MNPSTISSGVAPGCGRSGRNEKSGGLPSSGVGGEPGVHRSARGQPRACRQQRARRPRRRQERMPRRRPHGAPLGCRRRAPHPRAPRRHPSRDTSIGWVSPSASTAATLSSPGSAGIGEGAVSLAALTREGEHEVRAAAELGPHGELAAVQPGVAERDGQSEARCRRSSGCATGRRARTGRTRARRPAGVMPSP